MIQISARYYFPLKAKNKLNHPTQVVVIDQTQIQSKNNIFYPLSKKSQPDATSRNLSAWTTRSLEGENSPYPLLWKEMKGIIRMEKREQWGLKFSITIQIILREKELKILYNIPIFSYCFFIAIGVGIGSTFWLMVNLKFVQLESLSWKTYFFTQI